MDTGLLKDFLPMTNGIFHYMDYSFSGLNVNDDILDFLLYSNYGEKNVNNVILTMTGNIIRPLEIEEMTYIANIAISVYKRRWDNYLSIIVLQYNRLEPYKMDKRGSQLLEVNRNYSGNEDFSTEEEIDRADEQSYDNYAKSRQGTVRDTYSGSDSTEKSFDGSRSEGNSKQTTYNTNDTRTDNTAYTLSGQYTDVGSGNNINSVWGFNSGNAVNREKDDRSDTNTRTYNNYKQQDSGNETNLKTGTVTETDNKTYGFSNDYAENEDITYGKVVDKTETIRDTATGKIIDSHSGTIETSGTKEKSETDSTETSGSNTSVITGNIGNKSYQNLIEEDITLWEKNFIDKIIKNVVDLITIKIYI